MIPSIETSTAGTVPPIIDLTGYFQIWTSRGTLLPPGGMLFEVTERQ